jgi:hypothetical protein
MSILLQVLIVLISSFSFLGILSITLQLIFFKTPKNIVVFRSMIIFLSKVVFLISLLI